MKKIIVRMPNWLGDLVMSTPVLKVLRNHYPNAHICAMCQSSVADLLIANPHIDEILRYNKPRSRREKKAIIQRLRAREFDMGVLLTNSVSSAWWFFRGRVKKRIGFANDCRSILLTNPVSFPKNRKSQHLVFTYLELLGERPFCPSPELYVTDEERVHAHCLLKRYGWVPGQKIVGFAPGAAFGTAKRWLPERFRAVAQKLIAESNALVLCLGHSSEVELGETICNNSQIVNLVGQTSPRELLAFISVCDIFLANDSGPMHIAAALRIPVVALFGPTDDRISRPYPHGIIVHKRVSCSPCHKRVCPTDHACMKEISVEEVCELLRRNWGSCRSLDCSVVHTKDRAYDVADGS